MSNMTNNLSSLSSENLQKLVTHVDLHVDTINNTVGATVWHRWDREVMNLASLTLHGSRREVVSLLRDALPVGVIIKTISTYPYAL